MSDPEAEGVPMIDSDNDADRLRARYKIPRRVPWQVVYAMTEAFSLGARSQRIAVALAKDREVAPHLAKLPDELLPEFFKRASMIPAEASGNLRLASAAERKQVKGRVIKHARALRLLIERTPDLFKATVFDWLGSGMHVPDFLALMRDEDELQQMKRELAEHALRQLTLPRVLEAVESSARQWRGGAGRNLRSVRDRYVILTAGWLREQTGKPHAPLVQIAAGHALGGQAKYALTRQKISEILGRARK